MAENKKFTKLINSDGTKQAVALDKVSFDDKTKKLTLYSSVDNSIKEETTIPASEVDTTLSKSGLAADAKATGDAVKDVVKVGGTASGFTGIIVGTGEEEIELVEQKDFDAEIAKLNAKVGTPLVANAASAMVDTTKIYVYTGNENGYVNGNWYFYNGTNWESGGVYNAVAVQTDKTLTQENKAADAKKTGDDISELKEDFTQMESDGVVPSAEQIISDKYTEDKVPYLFRPTGGDGADREYMDAIVGGTVNWNQLVPISPTSRSTIQNGVTLTDNRDGSYTFFTDENGATQDTFFGITQIVDGVKKDHIYAILGLNSSSSQDGWFVGDFYNGNLAPSSGKANDVSKATGDGRLDVRIKFNAGVVVSTPITIKPQYLNLTAMFGSTIADYIYSLEQTTAGAGIAFFKKLFPKDYYEYNAGELKSVEGVSAHKTVGINQWDEEYEIGAINDTTGENTPNDVRTRSVNYIPVIPNAQYYFKKGDTPSTVFVYWYNAEKTYLRYETYSWSYNVKTIPSDAYYMRFMYIGTTYNHDICINFSDPTKNGTYEPYKAHSYALDDSLTLRGLFKLDANNKLYADGDTYEYTGKVTRNTILRAYQSGDESLANAITDGTNTVVYSANASTEQADPYQHLQQCDPNGTEEYVSTGIVPVGHNTQYPENLRAKIEGLPWNFASLIAPTESAFVATRNYVTGDLFIVSNVLYKATSNIANGGTITPNTNCTATTLAEIISALA